jgi:hypothetical protein
VIGDGIEQKSMMGHQGVGAKYGCRFGTCEGEHPDDKPKKTMACTSRKETESCVQLQVFNLRIKANIL